MANFDAVPIVRSLMGRTDALPPIPERKVASSGWRLSQPKIARPSPAPANAGELRASTPFLVMGAAGFGWGALSDRFGGEVPDTLEEVVTLPGVGRKTANLVLADNRRVPSAGNDQSSPSR